MLPNCFRQQWGPQQWSTARQVRVQCTADTLWQHPAQQKETHVTCQVSHTSNAEDSTNLRRYFFLIEVIPLCFDSKSETKCFTITIKTQQQCIIINILLWQHVSVLLDHLQASIQRYEVQSVRIMYCGIPHYLQGVHTNSLNL